ncbi:MAG: molybdenum cofactor guanylyltransferase MobA [Comamonadaceae bacterium]|nr:MAG: molybdenum cofactor guanylyltransferase MobA [Comamonadaceae bacterium]
MTSPNTASRCDITGLVLAGGRGTRMGGVEKGLQLFNGVPLALNALQRLQPQVGPVAINANRDVLSYEFFGAPVWPDALAGHALYGQKAYAGPLAGMLAGLAHCATPWLMAVPCDTPLFPEDLVVRMAQAAASEGADIAVASAPDEQGQQRPQPVFCLMKKSLAQSLAAFIEGGGSKVGAWVGQHHAVTVTFGPPRDDARAFFNANTAEELKALEAT